MTQSVMKNYSRNTSKLRPYHQTIKTKNQVCIESVPPEEILISRHARTIETAYVAHRMIKSVSELVAMGYDQEEMKVCRLWR